VARLIQSKGERYFSVPAPALDRIENGHVLLGAGNRIGGGNDASDKLGFGDVAGRRVEIEREPPQFKIALEL
jgi:hypothetical protein